MDAEGRASGLQHRAAAWEGIDMVVERRNLKIWQTDRRKEGRREVQRPQTGECDYLQLEKKLVPGGLSLGRL